MQLTFACRRSTTLLFSQRSISFRTEARPLPPAPLRARTKASSFPRRRNSQCWSDTVESHDLTVKEIKRQEVRGGGRWTKFTSAALTAKPSAGLFNVMQCALRVCGSVCGAEVAAWAGWWVATLYFCEAGLHRDYERGCELALAQLPLLNNQLWKLSICVFLIVCKCAFASTCCRYYVRLLSGCDSCAGDLRADSGRETTHWWPQSGQEGTCATKHHHCHVTSEHILLMQVEYIWKGHSTPLHRFLTLWYASFCTAYVYLFSPYLCLQVYYEPMLKLEIMTESELGQIFGTLDSLIPLHQGKPPLCFAHIQRWTQPPHFLIVLYIWK